MNNPLLIFGLGTGEIVSIVVVIVLLFGGRKIPGLMRGLGKGIRSFKEGMNEVESEINKPVEKPKQSDGDTQK